MLEQLQLGNSAKNDVNFPVKIVSFRTQNLGDVVSKFMNRSFEIFVY